MATDAATIAVTKAVTAWRAVLLVRESERERDTSLFLLRAGREAGGGSDGVPRREGEEGTKSEVLGRLDLYAQAKGCAHLEEEVPHYHIHICSYICTYTYSYIRS